MIDDYLERLEHHLEAYREDDDSEFIDNPIAYYWLTVGDQRAAVAELRQLRAERDAWREGVVTRLEQATGQKVTLMLSPKDQCAATFAAEVRWDFQCEKLGGHAELHRVRVSGGFVEWRGAEDVAVDAVSQQPKREDSKGDHDRPRHHHR